MKLLREMLKRRIIVKFELLNTDGILFDYLT